MVLVCVYESASYKILHITDSITEALDFKDTSGNPNAHIFALTPTKTEKEKLLTELKVGATLPEYLIIKLEG